ncbi:MAG TPA: glycoside hydrolase [bacterium]|nr:glycoside hydrolase [bacterium]
MGKQTMGVPVLLSLGLSLVFAGDQAGLNINDREYLDMPGLSVLVFHNNYPEGHQGGVELIQHGERIVTNGDLRLEPTPGQWNPLPRPGKRIADRRAGRISVPLHYPEADLDYTIHVSAEGKKILLTVELEKPPDESWVGKAGFQIEIFPALYFGKTWMLGDRSGVFPRQFNGPVADEEDGPGPVPLAEGKRFVAASGEDERRIAVTSLGGELRFYDGRFPDNNGWFVIREEIPAGQSGVVISWKIEPSVLPDWKRRPVILHSQVGYHPGQEKRILIELDSRDKDRKKAELIRFEEEGGIRVVRTSVPRDWGRFLRYDYAVFDVTDVRTPGLYAVRYGEIESHVFRLAADIYARDVWQPTLETYFPVQMCHMQVRDRFRIWHGACHLDDALQAPTRHNHIDGYRSGEETETAYRPFEHVPGLNAGGWHDAGDYDIAAGSQSRTVFALALAAEQFHVRGDQVTVDYENRMVRLHRPDGVPDIVQQIEHGVLAVLSGYRIQGHCFPGIISATVEQYVHLGDGVTMTDGMVYDASGDTLPEPRHLPGAMDDRWVFTNRSTPLEYLATRALTAASRVLRSHNESLARECLETALRAWTFEQRHEPKPHRSAYIPGDSEAEEILATIELFLTTQDDAFLDLLEKKQETIAQKIDAVGWSLARILPFIESEKTRILFETLIRGLAEKRTDPLLANPFGVPFEPQIWGAAWGLQSRALRHYFLHRAFPALFDREGVFRVVDYVLGCHPGSSTSLVSGVGSHSLIPAYGVNREDGSYIPGGMVSGVALIRPDFPELKEPWPYLWQQSEYVMPGAAEYIFCVLAAEALLRE